MKKTALITGISGQDGSYLAKFLIGKKYTVIGTDRRSARKNDWRTKKLGIHDNIIFEEMELSEINQIIRIFNKYKIDEVYNFAAQSFVASSFENPIYTCDVNSLGVLRILEVIRNLKFKPKFYQASTSEMFGNSLLNGQKEFNPVSPYGTSKLFAHITVSNYRDSYNLYAVSGLLFNHESPLRGEEFITRKITLGLAEINAGEKDFIEIGNIEAKRDWGYAEDYVEAIWKMLQQKKPQDYVIGTGKSYSIKEFIDEAVKYCDFEALWVGKGLSKKLIRTDTKKTVIKINPKFYRPTEIHFLKCNFNDSKKILNWKPKTNFKDLVKIMMLSDLQKI